MLTIQEFHEALRRLMIAWRDDSDDAVAALDLILSQGDSDMKATCLFYQGSMNEGKGALEVAWQSWSNGLQYAREGSFVRFELELSLGRICEDQAKPEEALQWFKKALQTCCQGDEFAGVKALTGYLRLNDGRIEPGDEALFACVVEKSWRVLELAGGPDAHDWAAASARLAGELQSRAEQIIADS